jgi:hypothetical protein
MMSATWKTVGCQQELVHQDPSQVWTQSTIRQSGTSGVVCLYYKTPRVLLDCWAWGKGPAFPCRRRNSQTPTKGSTHVAPSKPLPYRSTRRSKQASRLSVLRPMHCPRDNRAPCATIALPQRLWRSCCASVLWQLLTLLQQPQQLEQVLQWPGALRLHSFQTLLQAR